jgi:hypothetical protein
MQDDNDNLNTSDNIPKCPFHSCYIYILVLLFMGSLAIYYIFAYADNFRNMWNWFIQTITHTNPYEHTNDIRELISPF